MEYKNPTNIYYTIAALTAAALLLLSFRKKERIMAALSLGMRVRFKALRLTLLTAGLALTVFSLLGPQVFSGYAQYVKTGTDIYVLIDTSKSMLVTDVKPDRLTVAKKIIENLLDSFTGDRIGFIPFASDAYIQMPLTDDYRLAVMFLEAIDTDMIGGGGTNLAAAVRLADGSFERASESNADRVILIISDGEEHEGTALDIVKNVAAGTKIFTVGVGTERGGLVPVYDASGAVVSYIGDGSGNPVTSRLEAGTLRELARAGNGSYYQADLQGVEAASLIEDLSALSRNRTETESVKKFEQLYQYFLGAGILLIVLCRLTPESGRGEPA